MQYIVRKTWLGTPVGAGDRLTTTQILATHCSQEQARTLAEGLGAIYQSSSYDAVLDCWVVEDADASVFSLSIEPQTQAAA